MSGSRAVIFRRIFLALKFSIEIWKRSSVMRFHSRSFRWQMACISFCPIHNDVILFFASRLSCRLRFTIRNLRQSTDWYFNISRRWWHLHYIYCARNTKGKKLPTDLEWIHSAGDIHAKHRTRTTWTCMTFLVHPFSGLFSYLSRSHEPFQMRNKLKLVKFKVPD